jgi:hypothetical protein
MKSLRRASLLTAIFVLSTLGVSYWFLSKTYPKAHPYLLLFEVVFASLIAPFVFIMASTEQFEKRAPFYISSVVSLLPLASYALLLINFDPNLGSFPPVLCFLITASVAAFISFYGLDMAAGYFYLYLEQIAKEGAEPNATVFNVRRALIREYVVIGAPIAVLGFLPFLK